MRRSICRPILLGVGLMLGLEATAAQAQIPLFYGGEVLTPLGNRRSDGSYIYPYQRPGATRQVRSRSYTTAASRSYATRYYFPAQGSYYTPFPGTSYRQYGTYRRGGRWR